MKYYEMALSGRQIGQESSGREDIYLHDEDDRPGMPLVLLPLLALEVTALLMQLI